MRSDLLHRLDDVQRVLAGPITLKPLDVLTGLPCVLHNRRDRLAAEVGRKVSA